MDFEPGHSWTCTPEDGGLRLDKFLNREMEDLSRSQVHAWLQGGHFTLNGKKAKKNATLKAGDKLDLISVPPPVPKDIVPENIPLEVVYEDEYLAVINKPKNMLVHPGAGHPSGTLVNGLAWRYQKSGGPGETHRPGIVHRLDKDTSGLMVVGREEKAHRLLSEAIAQRRVDRIYYALAWRPLDSMEGKIERPVGRDMKNRTRMTVTSDGRDALTHFKVEENFDFACFLRLKLETGRTHQIRVHLASLGHPVLGDEIYGGKPYSLQNISPPWRPRATGLMGMFTSQALHAGEIRFVHPITGKPMEFTSPLHPEIEAGLEYLRDGQR